MGHGFTAVVMGPADGTAWDAKKQDALFALYERLADDSVAFPSGCYAEPVPLVKGTPRVSPPTTIYSSPKPFEFQPAKVGEAAASSSGLPTRMASAGPGPAGAYVDVW